MAVLIAPVILVAVVAFAVAGRSVGQESGTAPSASSVVLAARAADASLPTATPLPRSDWPAALADRYPPAEPVNKYTIDDLVSGWSASDMSAPWVRRLHGLSNYRTDPYER